MGRRLLVHTHRSILKCDCPAGKCLRLWDHIGHAAVFILWRGLRRHRRQCPPRADTGKTDSRALRRGAVIWRSHAGGLLMKQSTESQTRKPKLVGVNHIALEVGDVE